MINRIVPIAAVAAIFLIGCGETQKETASDIAKANEKAGNSYAEARIDADKAIIQADAKAQVKLGAAEADAMTKKAQAEFDLTMTTAKGTYKVATQKCDALAGANQTACESTADAALATVSANATETLDAALVAAEYHK